MDTHSPSIDCNSSPSHVHCTPVATVLDTDNLHFFNEFLDFLVQADADIHADVLGLSARFHCDFFHNSARKESRQKFRADSCGKWRNLAGTYVQCFYIHLQHNSFISGVE